MQTQIIAFANQKGGVGKTTTAINAAACLAELGKKVLVIDLDPQANATSGLGVERVMGHSIYDALLGDVAITDIIKQTSTPNLDIIPSELDLAGAEVDIARRENYLHCMKEVLKPVTDAAEYDYMLLDCPPSLGILFMNALTAAHSVIIPIQCEYYALEGLSVITGIIQQLAENGTNPELSLEGIVMTMYDARTNLSRQVVREVNQHFGGVVYETLIPRSVRISEAPSHGVPVIEYDPSSFNALMFRRLAREINKRVAARG
ncbi:ParA family protein [Verrucomicrobiota bacterium]